jgi:hypothetical protein
MEIFGDSPVRDSIASEGMPISPISNSGVLRSPHTTSDINDIDIGMASKESHQLEPIPQPPKRFLIGNLHLIDPEFPIGSFGEIAKEYGPIVKMALGPMYPFTGKLTDCVGRIHS